ncbi:hypothetical protein C8Q78DRAFT_1073613 [Trametes maxima]|nr:hypothetical protein C8Q78DRAFT_1073613 [Trametes maxima]
MPLGSVLDTSCVPPLSTPNLLKLTSSDIDKAAYLRSYIRAQEAYLADYATEGRSILASWGVCFPATPKQSPIVQTSARDFELESGFGTPLLKPRSRAMPLEGITAGRSKEVDGEQEESTTRLGKDRGSEARVRGKPCEHRADRNIAEPSHLEQPPKDKKTHVARAPREKAKDTKVRRAKTRKPKEPEKDEEHLRRLAERKERKRKKKAITDPRPVAPQKHSEGSSSDAEEHRTDSRSTFKKSKKGKGLNMPAGLALMHGFSATNIGKNRLTVQLDPALGVFNKGKASAKTTIKKKPTRPRLKLFSEQRFLSKPREDDDKERDKSRAPRDYESTSHSEDVLTRKRHMESATERVPTNAPRSKRPRSPPESLYEETTEVRPRKPETDHSPMRKRPKLPRPASPVWDIELEDGELPSRVESDATEQSEAETRGDGTVVLNTYTAKVRWVSAMQPRPQGSESEILPEGGEPPKGDQDPEEDASSLAPSNSASQAAAQGLEHPRVHATFAPAFSKYFPVPQSPQLQPEPEMSDAGPIARPPSFVDSALPPNSPQLEPNIDEPEDNEVRLGEPMATPLVDGVRVIALSTLSTSGIPLNQEYSPKAASPVSRAVSGSLLDFLPGPFSPTLSALVTRSRGRSPISPPIALPGPPDFPVAPVRHRECRRRPRASRLPTVLYYSPELDADHGYSNNPQTDGGVSSARSVGLNAPDWIYDGTTTRSPWDSQLQSELLEMPDRRRLWDNWAACEGYDDGADYLQVLPEAEFLEQGYPAMEPQQGYTMLPFHPQEEPFGYGDYCADNVEQLYDDPYALADGTFWVDADVCSVDVHDIEQSGDVWLEDSGGLPFEDGDELNLDDSGCTLSGPITTTTDLYEDLGFEDDENRSMLGSVQRFSQGRALLMGVSELGPGDDSGWAAVSRTEEDVARNLKGHWQPQRF